MMNLIIIGVLVVILIATIAINLRLKTPKVESSAADNSALSTSTQASEKSKKEDAPEITEAEKEARTNLRREELSKLCKPLSFPEEVVIYFGSQTGTAEKFANVLDEEAHKLHVNSKVVDLDKFAPEQFMSHKLVIFCVATHYEGDPTDNAKHFHKWLREQVKKQANQDDKITLDMRYCIFGLGDTSYEQYNEMAKFCDRSLSALGATLLGEIGAGNAETFTTEDDF